MARTYTLALRDPTNTTLVRDLSGGQFQMQATMRLNSAGSLTLVLPECDYPIETFDEDQILHVWVKPDRGPQFLMGERAWFLEYYAIERSGNGARTIKLLFGDGLSLLARRLVTYEAETAQADANAEACDNLIKRIFRQNGGVLAQTGSYNVGTPDGIRRLDPWIAVQADAGAAPPITKAYEHETLLPLFQDVASYSEAQGTRLYFDIAFANQVGAPIGELRTYVGSRGVDRSQTALGAAGVVISPSNETVGDYTLAYDYRRSARRAYAGSRGEGGGRVFATATDAGLAAYLANHPLAMRETFLNSSGLDPAEANFAAKLQTEVDVALHEALPVIQFDGQLTEQDSFRYGIQWRFGDRVTVAAEGQVLDVDVNALTVRLVNGREQIDVSVSNNVNRLSGTGPQSVQASVARLQGQVNRLQAIEVP